MVSDNYIWNLFPIKTLNLPSMFSKLLRLCELPPDVDDNNLRSFWYVVRPNFVEDEFYKLLGYFIEFNMHNNRIKANTIKYNSLIYFTLSSSWIKSEVESSRSERRFGNVVSLVVCDEASVQQGPLKYRSHN